MKIRYPWPIDVSVLYDNHRCIQRHRHQHVMPYCLEHARPHRRLTLLHDMDRYLSRSQRYIGLSNPRVVVIILGCLDTTFRQFVLRYPTRQMYKLFQFLFLWLF